MTNTGNNISTNKGNFKNLQLWQCIESHNIRKVPRKRSDRQNPLKAHTFQNGQKLVTGKPWLLQNGGLKTIYPSQKTFIALPKITVVGSIAKNTFFHKKGFIPRSSFFGYRSELSHTGWYYCSKPFVFIIASHKSSCPFSASRPIRHNRSTSNCWEKSFKDWWKRQQNAKKAFNSPLSTTEQSCLHLCGFCYTGFEQY